MKSDPKKSSRFDEQEPRGNLTAAPVFIFIVLSLLLYWAVLYLDQNAGGFNKMVYAPYRSMAELPVPAGDDTALGRRVYMASCAPCHQANGMGMAGQFPPLAGSEWVLTPGPGRAIRIVLDGVAGPMEVRGVHYNNAMVPWRDNLSDEEIAAVVTFIRNEWGNQASKVTPEQVAELRAATAGRGTYTAEELLRLPDTE